MKMTLNTNDIWPDDTPPGTYDISQNGTQGYPEATGYIHFVCPKGKRCGVLLGARSVPRPSEDKLCIWGWNGSVESPTLTPSLNCIAEKNGKPTGGCGWHGFITDGDMRPA